MNSVTMGTATQYLTFKLENEIFALEIKKVREVLDFIPVTKVPRTPSFMRGVVNLRGRVVPVVDLRLKCGMPPTIRTLSTCIIIVEAHVEGETTVLGALSDSVLEVLDIEQEQVESAPWIGTGRQAGFLKGMGKHDGRLILLLDIDKVFSQDELLMVQGSGPT